MYTPSCPSQVSWHDCAARAAGLGGRQGEQVCTAMIRGTSVSIRGLSASTTPKSVLISYDCYCTHTVIKTFRQAET